jgi:adenylate cyclase
MRKFWHRPKLAREQRAAFNRVREALRKAGASDAEIEQAMADDVIDLFAVDRLLVPAERRYTQHDVAEKSGMDVDMLARFWRALGFLDVTDTDRAFTDLDLQAVDLFKAMLEVGAADIDTALQLARVIGASMSRIAEAEVMPNSVVFGGGEQDSLKAADAFVGTADSSLPVMGWLLEFVWRRHVQAATRRSMLLRTGGHISKEGIVLAVGFADMVGFTLLSQHLTQLQLAKVVKRFEEISHDIVTGLGGRVVKMIGDEAMFVIETVVGAARIGLGLADAYADDELLSDVRVGLAVGPVLIHEADYFGPTVNLAHRIVNIANPGTVLMSDEFHHGLLLNAPEEFEGQALRPRVLKDLGQVQLWWCGRKGEELKGAGSSADRRRNIRWERLAEILRDLEDLRGVGERMFSGGRSLLGEPDGGDTERP